MRAVSLGLSRIMLLSSVAILPSCYVDPVNSGDADTSHQGVADASSREMGRDPSTCKYKLGLGCLDAHVDAVKPFYVDGRQFFNADDLASRFGELLKLQQDGRELKMGVDYKLVLASTLGNDSFHSGFTYNLGDPLRRLGELHTDGGFQVDNLPEGDYELFVQKPVRFMVVALNNTTNSGPATGTTANPATPAGPVSPATPPSSGSTANPGTPATPGTVIDPGAKPAQPVTPQPVVVQPANPAPTPPATHASSFVDAPAPAPAPTAPVGKTYCATLYSDQTVTIRPGTRLPLGINDFRLHVTDNVCAATGNETTINL